MLHFILIGLLVIAGVIVFLAAALFVIALVVEGGEVADGLHDTEVRYCNSDSWFG